MMMLKLMVMVFGVFAAGERLLVLLAWAELRMATRAHSWQRRT